MAFTLEHLGAYDIMNRQWTLQQIIGSIKGLGSVLNLVGRVDTIEALNAIANPKVGDVYLVGAEGSPEFTEWFRTPNDTWEYMGVTTASIDGYVDEYALYKGGNPDNPGVGTVASPASGTILAQLKSLFGNDIETAVNEVSETLDELSKDVDDYKTATDDRLEKLEVNFTAEAIQTMFDANTAALTTPTDSEDEPES